MIKNELCVFALPASLLNGAGWEVKRKVPVSFVVPALFVVCYTFKLLETMGLSCFAE